MCGTFHLLDSLKEDACARVLSCSGNSEPHDEGKTDTEGPSPKPEVLIFDIEKENLTPERIKVGASGIFQL